MSAPDYYQILGVKADASEAELKHAFRKLAREHHPDRHQDSAKVGAEARFKEVTAAYDVLSDPQKRLQYDQMRSYYAAASPQRPRAAGRQSAGYGFESPLGWEDLLGTFFGGQASEAPFPGNQAPAGRKRASETESATPLEISLEEAFHGATRELHNPRTGNRIRVKVPPGVKTGSTIRAGDLTLAITVLPDPRFERDGDDLRLELPVTFLEAIDGAELPVPTLDGSVKIKIPERTQSGKTFRLKGKGMPRLKGEGHGDLYAKIAIHLPPEIDEQALALWRRLGKLTPYDPRATR